MIAVMERVIGACFRTRDEMGPIAANELVERLQEGSGVADRGTGLTSAVPCGQTTSLQASEPQNRPKRLTRQ
jgi:hypothetical protein